MTELSPDDVPDLSGIEPDYSAPPEPDGYESFLEPNPGYDRESVERLLENPPAESGTGATDPATMPRKMLATYLERAAAEAELGATAVRAVLRDERSLHALTGESDPSKKLRDRLLRSVDALDGVLGLEPVQFALQRAARENTHHD